MNTSTRQPLRDRQLLVKNQVNTKCFSWRILIENIKWFVVDFIFLKHLLQPEIQSYIVLRDGCTDLVKKVSKDFIWLCFVSSQYSCISGSLTLAFYYLCNPRQSFTVKTLVFLFFLCICSFEKPFKRNCSLHVIIAISST